MFKYHLLLAVVLIMGLLGVCQAMAAKSSADDACCVKKAQPDDPAKEKALIDGNNQFALSMYEQLALADGKELANAFFSPMSISSALAMAYAGAGGATQQEMGQALGFTEPPGMIHQRFGKLMKRFFGPSDKPYEIRLANALWMQKDFPILASYTQTLQDYYHAAAESVDFRQATERARIKINDWVEQQTKDKIQNLIKPGVLTTDTTVVLTNAIYFKGLWAKPFSEKLTRPGQFLRLDGQTDPADFMFVKGHFRYAEAEWGQLVELPYEGDELSMVLLLPQEDDGLAGLIGQLDYAQLTAWLDSAREQDVRVHLPRFKMTCEYGLNPALERMGMRLAFNRLRADFSGITKAEQLAISAVVHKAFVEVNEKGTEAAAATAVVIEATAIGIPPKIFRADHPFVFMIRDLKSGSILFVGHLAAPAQASTNG